MALTTYGIVGIIGFVFWIAAILFGKIWLPDNPVSRAPIFWVFAYPILGCIFVLIGIIGLFMIAPVAEYFDWYWFKMALGVFI